jgi:two-component system, OmpR family, sensor kinase
VWRASLARFRMPGGGAARETIAGLNARVPLRVSLTALSVLLVGFGLVAAGVATRLALQSFLLDRVDQEFRPAEGAVLHWATDNPGGAPDRGAVSCIDNALPLNAYVAWRAPDGTVRRHHFHGTPSNLPGGLAAAAASAPEGYSSSGSYRLLAISDEDALEAEGPSGQPTSRTPPGCLPATGAPDGSLVIAIPISDVTSTLDRLTRLEFLVGLAVLAVAGGLAWVLVRVELRPLRRIEDTAEKIAHGDLSSRVDAGHPGTEVGSLGESLNAMLAQIERAFTEQRASENRLRRFVADAGHELRTPLTSVRGYAELFRRGASERPADLAVIMSRIESEAERMGVLVEDLLLLAKLDQGRPLERRPVALTEIVAEMATDQGLLFPDWPIELRAEPGVRLQGDELRIRQAVGNLLANARAHTPAGTRIDVSVATRDGSAVVEVADHGPGIPPELMARVFERFFRADPSRSRASGGSGLGLSIVAAIAEAHGGRVEVESPPGAGATFRIIVPLEPVDTGGEGVDAATTL